MRIGNRIIHEEYEDPSAIIDLTQYKTITAQRPVDTASARYGFVNTLEVAQEFIKAGWQPRTVSERRLRKTNLEMTGFQPHFIHFHNDNLPAVMGTQHPEIIFKNGHDCMTPAEILFGVFSTVCSNALIVCAAMLAAVRIKHGTTARAIVGEATANMIRNAPAIAGRIETLSARRLCFEEQLQFAQRALPVKFNDSFRASHDFNLRELVKPQRNADRPDNLYGLFNIVQEKFIKGGVMMQRRPDVFTNAAAGGLVIDADYEVIPEHEPGPRRSRKVTGALEGIRINQELWNTAEEYLTVN